MATRSRLLDRRLSEAEAARMARILYTSRNLIKIHPKRATVLRSFREGERFGITGAAWYDVFLALTMRDAGVRKIITENVTDFERLTFVTVQALGDL